MARYFYERLSHEGAAVLAHETSRHLGHAGATLVFEAGPLARPDGGIDFEAIRARIEARLARVPAYRRKLRRIPFENHPVWVDDHEFNLDFHLRHTSLARPGTPGQLRALAARIHGQRLDRSRPLWECWVVEGLEHGRFALLLKTHYALADGNAPDLLDAVLSTDAAEACGPAEPFHPRPMPSAFELVRDEVVRGARLVEKLGRSLRGPRLGTRGAALRRRAESLAGLLGYAVRRGPQTPLHGRVGPHRRCDFLSLPLADAELVRSLRGGSLDDVVLTVTAGAAARYLAAHYVNPATLDFRVAVPLEERHAGGRGRVVERVLELPLWEQDPLRRHELVRARTRAAGLGAEGGIAAAAEGAAFASTRLLARAGRAIPMAPVSLAVATVPGATAPLYLRGARLVEAFGKISLRQSATLSVAVLRYADRLCWGFNADFDLVPDLPLFAELTEAAFRELVHAARPKLALARAS